MPAVASLDDLRDVERELAALKERQPQAYEEVAQVFRRHRNVGYKNICKLMLGESTPEKLKAE